MTLRKHLLMLLLLLLAGSAAAMNIEELFGRFSQKPTAEEFGPLAQSFLQENDDLDELLFAGYMWSQLADSAYVDYLSQAIATHPEQPKWRFLAASAEANMVTRAALSRDLIRDFPQFEGGYQSLLFTHLTDLAYKGSPDQENPLPEGDLAADLPSIEHYCQAFPQARYGRMAAVFRNVMLDDPEAAELAFRQAWDSKERWLAEYDLSQILPIEKYHPILRCHINLLRASGSPDKVTRDLAEKAGLLAAYYFDRAKDYQAVIDFFGAEPHYWENQYVIFCLALSYNETGQQGKLADLLLHRGDFRAAEAFQDSWNAFNRDQAQAVYQDAFRSDSKDPLVRYLLARVSSNDGDKLHEGRKLAKAHPKESYGYRLINEYYLNYFGQADAQDPLRAERSKSIRKDKKYIANHLKLYPESLSAIVGSLLYNLAAKKDDPSSNLFQKVLSTKAPEQLYGLIYKFMADFGRIDLLRRSHLSAAQAKIGSGYENAAEAADGAVLGFCQSLYENGKYALMLRETDRNPAWLENPDLLFFLANAHYLEKDYAKAIATLRLMVEKGAIGTSMLLTMADDPIAEHPDWQPLLDFAATMPDPDADAADFEEME